MGCGPANLNGTIEPSHNRKLTPKYYRQRKPVNPDQITEQITVSKTKITQEQIKFALSILQHHQLFGTLNKKELKAIAQEMMVARPIDQKGFIFKQGDMGTCFFLIHSGAVDIEIDGKLIRSLGKGDTFGELALLYRCPRTASIINKSKDSEFLLVKPQTYKKTLKKMRLQEQFKNSEAIEKVPLFSCLTNKQKYALSNTIKIMIFNVGQIIFSAGDDAQTMYIISDGHVKISIEGKKDIQLHSGEIFGEASVQSNMNRSGTAKAVTKTICSMISRADIETTLGSSICNLIFYNTKKWALMRSSIFKRFTATEINKIIISFQSFKMEHGEEVDSSSYKGFIICLQGSINKSPDGVIFNENQWAKKIYKCDEGLIKKENGYCGFLSFTKASEIFEDIANKRRLINYQDKNKQNKIKFSLSNFIYLKKLGEGQFGQVFLVKNVQFGTNLYAIKCLSKEYIRNEQLQESVVAEKKVLEKIIFPYIVGFVKAFQDKNYIYLVMEYIHGKEMFDVIREVKSMTTQMVRYYFACLLLSIQYLHANNIVYRDLKPENSVVDNKGKAYLIDMGTAKELNSQNFFKTFTIIGTPHYMAPQVFEGNGYSFEVDIWSLGCVLYQYLCFKLPFGEMAEGDPYSIYTKIKKAKLTFPKFIKDQRIKTLLSQLLNKDPRKRAQFTFDKIKKSDYLKNVNWKGLLQQEVRGPYIPKEFKNNPLQDLHKLQGKDFLKHIYSSYNNKQYEIEEWNGTF